MKIPFASLTSEALEAELSALGARRFVADQVLEAVYRRNVRSFDEITNISKPLRGALSERYALRTLEIVQCAESSDGSFKLLLGLADGARIECALLASGRDRGTACISSQVGCAMGCTFCASGATGLERDLEPFEMIEQVLLVRDQLVRTRGIVPATATTNGNGRAATRAAPTTANDNSGQTRGSAPTGAGRVLSHVTVMGIGEPLANLDRVLAALEMVNSPRCLDIGARRIAISTCGLPSGIRRLAAVDRQYHLAVSLHAPNDDLRRKLMPAAARAATIAELLAACREYFERTHRKVTFEYALIRGVNDDLRHAEAVGRLLGDFPAVVNLIPVNPTLCCPDLAPPTKTQTGRFLATLERAGVEACVRRRRGAEVEAACGQLRVGERGGGTSQRGATL